MAKIIGIDYDNGEMSAVYVETVEGRQKFVRERHGRWIEVTKNIAWKCSECSELSCCEPNYCPNCGAKMDGGNDED